MSFQIIQKDLLKAIQKAYPIVPSNSSLQILLNLKLSFRDNLLEIAATDLDHSIKVITNLSGEGEYDITVNSKKLFEIVKELHDDVLTLSIDENVLIIDSGSTFSCKISGADTRDYPQFPEIKDSISLSINYNIFKNMVGKTNFAVSKDEARACLCGVLWELDSNKTNMVATDGHRLGYSIVNDSFDVEGSLKSIISPKSLLHAVKIFDEQSEESFISVQIGEKYVVMKDENVTLCTKLLDGPYPDYDKVIPKNNPKKCIINRSLLLESVKRVSVLSNQKTHLIKFIFNTNNLEIIVLNRDIGGEARQIVEAQYDGEEHIIGFNGIYLSEILNIIKTENIRFEMNTQISACLIYPEGEDNNPSDDTFLIMPLKILDEI